MLCTSYGIGNSSGIFGFLANYASWKEVETVLDEVNVSYIENWRNSSADVFAYYLGLDRIGKSV